MTRRHGHTAHGLDAQRADDWRDLARCRDEDPELFFPINNGPYTDQVWRARQICYACPARTACLDWAKQHRIPEGIWGAQTPDERSGRSLGRYYCQRCTARLDTADHGRLCNGCRNADTQRQAGHGSLSTYKNQGCRCEACRAANNDYVQRQRKEPANA